MAEHEANTFAFALLIVLLRHHYRKRHDVYVGGNLFWYYEENNPRARKAPDLMVVKGVDPGPTQGRPSFKSWEERANPCFILELTSEATADEDAEDKFELYQRLGVREYFLFDPLGKYLDTPLIGYRLIGERYERLAAASDRSVPSNELGLRFVPDGLDVTLIDMTAGRRLKEYSELSDELESLRAEAHIIARENERAWAAERDAVAEMALQRDEARRELQRAADEIAALKAQLAAQQAKAEGTTE